MNFIGRMEGHSIHVDLKYCERCGGLWLRPRGNDGVYCASCRVRVEAMPKRDEAPACKASSRKARLQSGPDKQSGLRDERSGMARIENLQGVAMMEVRA